MPRNKNENEVARARLAYITAGQPIDTAAKRSLGPSEQAESDDDSGINPAEPQPAVAQVSAAWAAKQLRSRYAIAVLVLLLLGVGVTILILTQSQASQVDLEPPPLEIAEPSQTSSTEPVEPVTIRVHVLGAVEEPGVVALEEGDIVSDALQAAGGLNKEADPGELNLAARLVDGQQIIVGTTDDPHGELRDASGAQSTDGDAGGLVNVNTADAAGLETLPGIGPVLAQAIITWREENNGFDTVADLQEVPGIGPSKFATLEPLVTV